jgi:hypothetical protein
MWLRHSVLNSRMCLWPQVSVEYVCPETFRVRWPMRDACLWETRLWETRLWDDLWEMYAYKMPTYRRYTYIREMSLINHLRLLLPFRTPK